MVGVSEIGWYGEVECLGLGFRVAGLRVYTDTGRA